MLVGKKSWLGFVLIIAALIVLVPITFAIVKGGRAIDIFSITSLFPIGYGGWLIWKKLELMVNGEL